MMNYCIEATDSILVLFTAFFGSFFFGGFLSLGSGDTSCCQEYFSLDTDFTLSVRLWPLSEISNVIPDKGSFASIAAIRM